MSNAVQDTFDMFGMVHLLPAPTLHLFETGAGIVVPTFVVPVYRAGRVGSPSELTNVVGKLTEYRFALAQCFLARGKYAFNALAFCYFL